MFLELENIIRNLIGKYIYAQYNLMIMTHTQTHSEI